MAGVPTQFVDRVPNYEVRDEVMHITGKDFAIAMPLRLFREGMLVAAEAIAKYDAKRAEVVPIRRRKRRH